ncbi:MAG: DUF2911 domain-containing protein [Acidobacteriia bacterium]|nr:DUF2911 domain-containing protein [Terriglobia bacterium]
MSKLFFVGALAGAGLLAQSAGQTSVTIESKTMTVKYGAAKTPVPAAFHTDADLVFKGFTVPKGDYTIYLVPAAGGWELAVNKATAAKTRDAKQDLGRTPMAVSKAASPASACTITLTKTAALAAKIEVSWENNVASAPFHLDRAADHSEW